MVEASLFAANSISCNGNSISIHILSLCGDATFFYTDAFQNKYTYTVYHSNCAFSSLFTIFTQLFSQSERIIIQKYIKICMKTQKSCDTYPCKYRSLVYQKLFTVYKTLCVDCNHHFLICRNNESLNSCIVS